VLSVRRGCLVQAKHKEREIEAALKQVEIQDEAELEEYSVEIDILSQCQHKNIVGLHEAYFFNNKLWVCVLLVNQL
jgi:STE20-like kinase